MLLCIHRLQQCGFGGAFLSQSALHAHVCFYFIGTFRIRLSNLHCRVLYMHHNEVILVDQGNLQSSTLLNKFPAAPQSSKHPYLLRPNMFVTKDSLLSSVFDVHVLQRVSIFCLTFTYTLPSDFGFYNSWSFLRYILLISFKTLVY